MTKTSALLSMLTPGRLIAAAVGLLVVVALIDGLAKLDSENAEPRHASYCMSGP